MAGRSIRIAFLTLAAWAVLFAPGAAADNQIAIGPLSPERVAAAIIAPTFGNDGVVVARSPRDDRPSDADQQSVASGVPNPSPGLRHGGGTSSIVEDPQVGAVTAVRQSAPARAPPTD